MRAMMRRVRQLGLCCALAPIFVWRYGLAAFFAPACRFEPSCSRYAEEALRQHGLVRGAGLSVWRLLRCQPFGGCGHDPVPGKRVSGAPVPGAPVPGAPVPGKSAER